MHADSNFPMNKDTWSTVFLTAPRSYHPQLEQILVSILLASHLDQKMILPWSFQAFIVKFFSG